jgi:hypothetical protein
MKKYKIFKWFTLVKDFIVKYQLWIGLVLSVIGIGLYLTFYPVSQNPHLTFYYKTFDLVKINETNENLKIYFKGDDIQKEKLHLTVFEVTLINDGKSDIDKTAYEQNIPFGIRISKGFITGCNVAAPSQANQDLAKGIYLKESADSTEISLEKVIIKVKEQVKIKFTVLHKEAEVPHPIIQGRIANTNIGLEEGDVKDGKDLWYTLKIIAYLGLGLLLLIITITGAGWVITWFISLALRLLIRSYYGRQYKGTPAQRAMVDIFAEMGQKDFLLCLDIIKDEAQVNSAYTEEKKNEEAVNRVYKLVDEKKFLRGGITSKEKYESDILTAIRLLLEDNLAKETSGTLKIAQNFLDEIPIIVGKISKDQ